MKTVKKISRGKLKGWNFRQTKNGMFHAYLGNTSQFCNFGTLKECMSHVSYHLETGNGFNSPMNEKYVAVMFPYPSGNGLHVGHWYNYSIIDSYCRYLRFTGNNVFQPFGYDSFGLPAENHARKIGGDPREITYRNIETIRSQMVSMDTLFEELVITSEPYYIRFTQFVFKEMLKRGVAYKAKGIQDYCSSCDTVLAREQASGGKCERCSTATEKKELNQWYLRITDYTPRLVKNLDKIDYPKKTINAQRAWLENQHDWCISRQRKWGCPIPVEGETDTMDTFMDSSIYTIYYCLATGRKPKPVDLYVGGSEHACMHLIYARFVTMFLCDIGFIDFEEPFTKVVHQGMILNNGEKMSKSKGNSVSLDGYDSDEIRFYLMFIGHYFDGGGWSDKNISGIKRFINRMAEWMSRDGEDNLDLRDFTKMIFGYTEDFKFNKVVSSFMILLNEKRNLNLSRESKNELMNLLEIYMPSIRKKIHIV